jgi:predicted NAD/FAD-binding protein
METLETEVAIVGGGISGLSAAWELGRLGIQDFLLLELESESGGNARGGKNPVSAYPWGAHYVPIPGKEATLVRELFEELGVITGYDSKGLPIYDEYFLCADPHERLFMHGFWQEGLVPQTGLPEGDRAQIHRFFSTMEELRLARGTDGRHAFAIPMAESSRDPRFTELDRISMAEWLERNHFDAAPLKWYVNYCCRDDYGTVMTDVSAWAGVHYFASRRGTAANADSQTVLTWPEGNSWLAARLHEKAGARVRGDSLVFNIEPAGEVTFIDSFNVVSKRVTRVKARAVVYAAPRFTAARVLKEFREDPPEYLKHFTYAPWMVANVTVASIPTGPGAAPSWDNVSYHSPSLGYITATHQNLSYHPVRSVLTYYLPLSEEEPAQARQRALARPHSEWVDLIVADLEHMHPGVAGQIENIDVWLWGHGMIRPRPGFVWGAGPDAAHSARGNVFFAHSDMSGISIFEEAQYHGVRAARSAARAIGRHA